MDQYGHLMGGFGPHMISNLQDFALQFEKNIQNCNFIKNPWKLFFLDISDFRSKSNLLEMSFYLLGNIFVMK